MYRSMIGIGMIVSALAVGGCAEDGAFDEGAETVQAAAPDEGGPTRADGAEDASDASGPTPRSATGGWIGVPVAVRIKVNGTSTWVSSVSALEKWNGGSDGNGATGHTEIYRRSKGHTYSLKNSAQHRVYTDNDGTTIINYSVNKDFLDGDQVCARFWIYEDGGWHNDGASCVNIED
jgi:hypothetical protein